MDRLSSTPSPDEQMRIDANIFSQSVEGQRMLLRNIGWNPEPLERDTSMVDETMQINQNTKDTADYVRELQITVTGLRNDLNDANEKIEQNRIDAERAMTIADKKNRRHNFWTTFLFTVLGAGLSVVFTILAISLKWMQ